MGGCQKKTRNLSLFAFGVLIAWGIPQIGGTFDQFTAAMTLEYLNLLLRVGFAGFVFANVETLAAEAESEVGGDSGDAGLNAGATVPASSAD